MVHEAKLHQFTGQMLAKTLSRAPVWPTVLGSVGALSPSAVSWAGRESLKRGSIAREQQVHKSLAILKQRRPRQPRGVPAMRETGWKMRLFGCAGIAAAIGSASPAGATASISAMFPDNPPV